MSLGVSECLGVSLPLCVWLSQMICLYLPCVCPCVLFECLFSPVVGVWVGSPIYIMWLYRRVLPCLSLNMSNGHMMVSDHLMVSDGLTVSSPGSGHP